MTGETAADLFRLGLLILGCPTALVLSIIFWFLGGKAMYTNKHGEKIMDDLAGFLHTASVLSFIASVTFFVFSIVFTHDIIPILWRLYNGQ